MAIQASYAINPEPGFPGAIAEPNSPHRLEAGYLVTGGARTNPRPGDGLFYDTSANGWRTPNSSSESVRLTGVLSYRADHVATADSFVQFAAGDEIQVITMGVFWAPVTSDTDYNSQLMWDRGSPHRWNSQGRVTSVNSMHEVQIYALNRFPASAGDIIKMAMGYGKAI